MLTLKYILSKYIYYCFDFFFDNFSVILATKFVNRTYRLILISLHALRAILISDFRFTGFRHDIACWTSFHTVSIQFKYSDWTGHFITLKHHSRVISGSLWIIIRSKYPIVACIVHYYPYRDTMYTIKYLQKCFDPL